MTDQPRRRREALPAPNPSPGRPVESEATSRRVVAPFSFREHLEREHGFVVEPEAGWPTEFKRFFLVREQDGVRKSVASYRGRQPEAVAYFYYLLHPEQRTRR